MGLKVQSQQEGGGVRCSAVVTLPSKVLSLALAKWGDTSERVVQHEDRHLQDVAAKLQGALSRINQLEGDRRCLAWMQLSGALDIAHEYIDGVVELSEDQATEVVAAGRYIEEQIEQAERASKAHLN